MLTRGANMWRARKVSGLRSWLTSGPEYPRVVPPPGSALGWATGLAVGCLASAIYWRLHDEQFSSENGEHEADIPLLEQFGLPDAGLHIRRYSGHAVSFNQARRTPRWVAEHITSSSITGPANRKNMKFKADPSIQPLFSAFNEDYLGSGWSRGHMAPAANYKNSQDAMRETFFLSNIVPQNNENNSGFWNRFGVLFKIIQEKRKRLEIYCRSLCSRFDDVWIISGPLNLPWKIDGKDCVHHYMIGKSDVAVPTHLFKVVLTGRSGGGSLCLGAFLVPNAPIGYQQKLADFQVSLSELEYKTGISFFPKLRRGSWQDLCSVDGCHLMNFHEMECYIAGKKLAATRSVSELDSIMQRLVEKGVEPHNGLLTKYKTRKEELVQRIQK
uniref:nuclease EXOG, mitochondrial-like isoform X2 n=1 Tax=Myxine glutinosa TaxID=7769 RepID=UPI00358E037D